MARLHPESENGMPYLEPRETQSKGRSKSCSLNTPCSQHHTRGQPSALRAFHLTYDTNAAISPHSHPTTLLLREPAWSSQHNIKINREDQFFIQWDVEILGHCTRIVSVSWSFAQKLCMHFMHLGLTDVTFTLTV